ncbi:MAG: HdeD family acid-resistance protein [Pseudoxanthomonas sp.]
MSTQPPISSPLALLGRGWWILLVYGLFAVLFGLVALTRPVAASAGLAWAIGVLALAEGVVSLFALFDRATVVSKGWLAFYAVASIAFGLLTVFNPLATAGVLLLFLAAWLIVGGIYRIVFAIRVRKEIRGEWLIVLSGALAIVLGVLFVLNPLSGIVVTTLWIGAFALVYGIFQIVAAFRVRRLKAS